MTSHVYLRNRFEFDRDEQVVDLAKALNALTPKPERYAKLARNRTKQTETDRCSMSLLSNIMKGSASAQRRIELAEVQRLTQAIAAGSLSARANVNTASGEPQAMLVAVNELLDAALLPIGEGNRILDRIAHGKIDELVHRTYQGDHERMKQNVNGIAVVLQKFQAELAKLTELSRQGLLSKRGDAAAFPGAYGDAIRGVNEMLDTVIAPLNVAANCVEQIFKGAIPAKITDNYNGDFNAIETNLNQCIDGLSGLREAEEVVQRMANNDHSKKVDGNYLRIFADLARGVNVVQRRFRHVTSTMRSIAQGNLEELAEYKKIARRSENDELVPAIITMMESLESLVADTNMLSKAAVDGKLATRADASRHQGDFRKVVQGVNDTLELSDRTSDSMPVPAMIIDRDFTVQYMNATGAHVGGKSPAEVVGTKCYDHFKTGDCKTEKCACSQAMRTENRANSETVARPSKGLELDISYAAVPMRDKTTRSSAPSRL